MAAIAYPYISYCQGESAIRHIDVHAYGLYNDMD